jgi:hypothetical protein
MKGIYWGGGNGKKTSGGIGPAGDGGGGALDAVADFDQRDAADGKEDFGAGAEADHAKALAAGEGLALGGPGDDAAGDEAGNLADGDGAVLGFEPPGAAFVAGAGVGVADVEELAGLVDGALDFAGDGGAVDVDVEDGEEDGDADHGAEMEIGLVVFLDADDEAVGGGDDDVFVGGDGAFGVAEEVEDEEKQKGDKKSRHAKHDPAKKPSLGQKRRNDENEYRHKDGERNAETQHFLMGRRHMRRA